MRRSEGEVRQHAPGQRDAQQLVERVPDDERRDHGDDAAPGRGRSPKITNSAASSGRGDEQETHAVGQRDVEQARAAITASDGDDVARRARPRQRREPGLARAAPQAADDQEDAADREPGGDQARETSPARPAGPESSGSACTCTSTTRPSSRRIAPMTASLIFIAAAARPRPPGRVAAARRTRPRGMPPRPRTTRRSACRERHFARPSAFMTSPMLLSPFAM